MSVTAILRVRSQVMQRQGGIGGLVCRPHILAFANELPYRIAPSLNLASASLSDSTRPRELAPEQVCVLINEFGPNDVNVPDISITIQCESPSLIRDRLDQWRHGAVEIIDDRVRDWLDHYGHQASIIIEVFPIFSSGISRNSDGVVIDTWGIPRPALITR